MHNMWKSKLGMFYDPLVGFAKGFGWAGGMIIAFSTYQSYQDNRLVNKAVFLNYTQRVNFLKEQKVKFEVESIRDEVETIRENENSLKNGKFILIRGPRGVGKTSAINTALKDIKGVITVGPIKPGLDQDEILDKVSKEITGLDGGFETNKDAMKMLVKMYQEHNKRPLVVLLQASERPINEKPASLTAAARILVDSFGLKVIIDCSENAAPTTFTNREKLLDFEPMSYELMCQLPKYEAIAEELTQQGNADIVLAVCGGRPLFLDEVSDEIQRARNRNLEIEKSGGIGSKLKIEDIVRNFVEKKMGDARLSISKVISHPEVVEVLKRFKNESEIVAKNFPDMKDVLRIVRSDLFVPATGAVAIWLRMGVERVEKEKATFDEVKQWLSKQDESVKAALLNKNQRTEIVISNKAVS